MIRARPRSLAVRVLVVALAIGVASACVSSRGGWDLGAVERSTPALEDLSGHRLGDLVPFPALDVEGRDDRIVLVACRFASGSTVRVRGEGSDWPTEWAAAAVVALDERLPTVDVVSVPPTPPRGGPLAVRPASPAGVPPVEIQVRMLADAEGEGPNGMGDTLTACDVSPGPDGRPARGVLLGAEIRMRVSRPGRAGRARRATADEWVGAFLHELGHAMGFTGHAAIGDSVLVRDAMQLRRLGRRALEGEPDRDATLAALYALPVGARLGTHPLDARGARVLARARAAVRERAAGGERLVSVVSVAGDRAARIAWRFADGTEVAVRMPAYAAALRRGEALAVLRERDRD